MVTQRITIDGYTQPGATENALAQGNNAVLRIELDGSSAPGAFLPDGLLIRCIGQREVRGLVINRFAGEGVQLERLEQQGGG